MYRYQRVRVVVEETLSLHLPIYVVNKILEYVIQDQKEQVAIIEDLWLSQRLTILRLRKFNPKKTRISLMGPDHNNFSVIFGRRASGKSYLLKDLILQQDIRPTQALLVSPTADYTGQFNNIFPKELIHEDLKPELLSAIINRQRNIIRAKGNNKQTRLLLAIDDHIFSPNNMSSGFRQLVMNGRHINTDLLITLQTPTVFPAHIRANIDYIFIGGGYSSTVKQQLYNQFASYVFPTFNLFEQVLDECTENYNFLVIDNTSLSNNFRDSVFWYRANRNNQ